MKKIAVALLLSMLSINISFAFSVTSSLEEQLGTQVNLTLSGGQLTLNGDAPASIYASPNYKNDREIYVTTADNNYYWNNQFEPNFNKLTKIPVCTQKVCPHVFIDDYANTGYQLFATENKIYMSYDRGQTWQEQTPSTSESIESVAFGPKFTTSNLIYFITSEGLYKYSTSSKDTTLVLAAAEGGEQMEFRYPFNENTDRIFYVRKGDTIYKTEDGGTTWFQKEFTAGIVSFNVIPNGTDKTRVIVTTQDNKFMVAEINLDFFSIPVPASTTIYDFKSAREDLDTKLYVLNTDKGFYYSYDKGSIWTNKTYSSLGTVKDYMAVKSGTQYLLFIVTQDKIYRDIDFSGTLTEFMKGIGPSYLSAGMADSVDMVALSGNTFADNYQVNSVTLSADGDLNGQEMKFYVTTDDTNWEPVELDQSYDLQYPGTALKWRVEMNTTDSTKSPVLRSVTVDYGVEQANDYCAGFPDVKNTDELCPAITYVKDAGIFSGYPDGTFQPAKTINRAETVKVIAEGFDITKLADDGTNLGFSDVIKGEWYMPYLRTAKTNGVIQGYPDGTFRPDNTVNYIEMLKIFFETADVGLTDASGAQWYEKYVNYAKEKNLVPSDNITADMSRGKVAELFYEWHLLQQ